MRDFDNIDDLIEYAFKDTTRTFSGTNLETVRKALCNYKTNCGIHREDGKWIIHPEL